MGLSALCSLAEAFQYSAYVPTCQYPPDTYYRARGEVNLRELSRGVYCTAVAETGILCG